jgi:hypothetical protein
VPTRVSPGYPGWQFFLVNNSSQPAVPFDICLPEIFASEVFFTRLELLPHNRVIELGNAKKRKSGKTSINKASL